MRMRSWWLAGVAIGFGAIGLCATAPLAHAQDTVKSPTANPSSKPLSKKADKKNADKSASSDDEPAERPISVALLGGYGHTFNADDDLNPLAVGFGVRGGYNLGELYLGLRFLFFLGDSESMGTAEVSANTMTVGIEAGYDLALASDVLVLRPELGLGLGLVEGEQTAGAEATMNGSSEDLYIAPGLALLVNVGERSIIGIDLQAPIVFSDDIEVALTALAVAGMHF